MGILVSVGSSASVGTFIIALSGVQWKDSVDADIKSIKSDVSENVMRTNGLYPKYWDLDKRTSILEDWKQQKK